MEAWRSQLGSRLQGIHAGDLSQDLREAVAEADACAAQARATWWPWRRRRLLRMQTEILEYVEGQLVLGAVAKPVPCSEDPDPAFA